MPIGQVGKMRSQLHEICSARLLNKSGGIVIMHQHNSVKENTVIAKEMSTHIHSARELSFEELRAVAGGVDTHLSLVERDLRGWLNRSVASVGPGLGPGQT